MVRLIVPVTGGIIEVVDAKAAKFIARGFRAVDAPVSEKPKKKKTAKKEQ